jgi:hypothetical protein
VKAFGVQNVFDYNNDTEFSQTPALERALPTPTLSYGNATIGPTAGRHGGWNVGSRQGYQHAHDGQWDR